MKETSAVRIMMNRALGPLLFCVAFAVFASFIQSPYYQLVLTLVAIWAVMGLSWNILSGYTGLISFGHAAFFGLGAYAVAISFSLYGLTPWLGIPLAGLIGAVAGLLIGLPTFRLRGHYFALAMLAYPLALLYLFEWLGFQEVSLPMKRDDPARYLQFSDPHVYTLIGIAFLFLTMVITRMVEESRFGRSLIAIKQNEPAAEAAGIDAWRCKLLAIILSGAIAGAIGGFYAVILLIVTPPTVFGMLASAQALVVALFGGIGTVWGPVIGSVFLIPVGEILHAKLGNVLPGIQGVVFGVAIIAAVLLAPEGIYWRVRDAWRARHPGKASAPPRPELPENVFALPANPGIRRDGGVILDVQGLSKAFGGLKAVQNVSFSIERGELVGIIGPNGAGKTTLFNLLNGFLPPSEGRVFFEDENIVGMRPNSICRFGIGRTFQIVRPFPRMTVFDNVVIGAYQASRTRQEAEFLAGQAIDIVGLTNDAGLIASGLTSKQLRLLELGRALAGRPKLLLLDETLAGLGAQEVEDILALIKRIAATGVTIVIIEHTMHAMVRLAERFIVLDHGAVVATGSPREVTQNPSVIEAYLGKKWRARA